MPITHITEFDSSKYVICPPVVKEDGTKVFPVRYDGSQPVFQFGKEDATLPLLFGLSRWAPGNPRGSYKTVTGAYDTDWITVYKDKDGKARTPFGKLTANVRLGGLGTALGRLF